MYGIPQIKGSFYGKQPHPNFKWQIHLFQGKQAPSGIPVSHLFRYPECLLHRCIPRAVHVILWHHTTWGTQLSFLLQSSKRRSDVDFPKWNIHKNTTQMFIKCWFRYIWLEDLSIYIIYIYISNTSLKPRRTFPPCWQNPIPKTKVVQGSNNINLESTFQTKFISKFWMICFFRGGVLIWVRLARSWTWHGSPRYFSVPVPTKNDGIPTHLGP